MPPTESMLISKEGSTRKGQKKTEEEGFQT